MDVGQKALSVIWVYSVCAGLSASMRRVRVGRAGGFACNFSAYCLGKW